MNQGQCNNIKLEYQKITNLLDNTSNQLSKFRAKHWVEINDESRGAYNVNRQIKLKTAIIKSSLCDYCDAYIVVKGTVTVDDTSAAGAAANNTNKKVMFKNYALFTHCIREINNTQVDHAKDIDIVRPIVMQRVGVPTQNDGPKNSKFHDLRNIGY